MAEDSSHLIKLENTEANRQFVLELQKLLSKEITISEMAFYRKFCTDQDFPEHLVTNNAANHQVLRNYQHNHNIMVNAVQELAAELGDYTQMKASSDAAMHVLADRRFGEKKTRVTQLMKQLIDIQAENSEYLLKAIEQDSRTRDNADITRLARDYQEGCIALAQNNEEVADVSLIDRVRGLFHKLLNAIKNLVYDVTAWVRDTAETIARWWNALAEWQKVMLVLVGIGAIVTGVYQVGGVCSIGLVEAGPFFLVLKFWKGASGLEYRFSTT